MGSELSQTINRRSPLLRGQNLAHEHGERFRRTIDSDAIHA